jgi:hypothetical protein
VIGALLSPAMFFTNIWKDSSDSGEDVEATEEMLSERILAAGQLCDDGKVLVLCKKTRPG